MRIRNILKPVAVGSSQLTTYALLRLNFFARQQSRDPQQTLSLNDLPMTVVMKMRGSQGMSACGIYGFALHSQP